MRPIYCKTENSHTVQTSSKIGSHFLFLPSAYAEASAKKKNRDSRSKELAWNLLLNTLTLGNRVVFKMQGDPVYDYPEIKAVGDRRACLQRGSLKSISVLDRLLLTHPVWLQLSINSATALHILQREPPGVSGTFITFWCKETYNIANLQHSWKLLVICRPSLWESPVHRREKCCAFDWQMTACPLSLNSFSSEKRTLVSFSVLRY